MEYDEVMYYYYFIEHRREMEMKEFEKLKGQLGGPNITYIQCPAPEGAPSWEAWEKSVIAKKNREV